MELRANIDEIGAFGHKPLGVTDCRLGLQIVARIGEAVRRDIHDAHDARPVHGNAGNRGARCREPVEQLLDARLVDGLKRAEPHNGVLDVAGFAFPKAHRSKGDEGASRKRQCRAKLDRLLRNRPMKQANRFQINARHRSPPKNRMRPKDRTRLTSA